MDQEPKTPRIKNWFSKFDNLLKPFVPNFNVRAVLYISLVFATVIYLQVWRISSPSPVKTVPAPAQKQETVIADQAYWQSQEYKNKIQNQTTESFASELQNWLDDKSQEFVKRQFEDIFYINSSLTPQTGGDLTSVVPQNFNYLENNGKARYQYAKANNFISDKPTLVSLGNAICDLDDKTEKVTSVEMYDFRYASMPKLASFMKTNPDWKMQVGDRILDVSSFGIEDKDILKSRNAQTQPAGLFSFLIFHDTKTNKIFLADSTILENNGIDARLTLGRISSHWDKSPKIYFKYGYEGCSQINSAPQINYGQSN